MTHDDQRFAAHIFDTVAGRRVIAKSCGHSHHVGTCAVCQRAQLTRWEAQLSGVKRSTPARSAV